MDNLSSIGATFITLGIISILLSVVNLQFKALGFLGEYKIYVEIGSIIIGIIIMIIGRIINKNKKQDGEQNAN